MSAIDYPTSDFPFNVLGDIKEAKQLLKGKLALPVNFEGLSAVDLETVMASCLNQISKFSAADIASRGLFVTGRSFTAMLDISVLKPQPKRYPELEAADLETDNGSGTGVRSEKFDINDDLFVMQYYSVVTGLYPIVREHESYF